MIAAIVVALALGLLPPAPVPADGLTRSVLTAGGTAYHYRYDGDRLVVRAERGRADPNRRELVVPDRASRSRDQLSCATWVRESGLRMQQGLAVRVVHQGRRVRAVTLTKNVFGGTQTVMNLLTWDTARRGDPWRAVGQFDLAAVLLHGRKPRPLPWRACLRVVGRKATFKVWPLGRVDRPSWRDPRYARTARLPRAFDRTGRPGWYVGHVPPGGSAVYRGLRTSPSPR